MKEGEFSGLRYILGRAFPSTREKESSKQNIIEKKLLFLSIKGGTKLHIEGAISAG